MTLKTLGMGIAKVLTKGKKVYKATHDFKPEKKALKKLLDKKKGKDLDWGDVQKSYKIFTKSRK